MSANLERLARRVADDPFFLASALAAYAFSERLDEPALAARLGCPLGELARLRLCRMPRPQPPLFGQDLDQIAARFALVPDVLAEVVRRGQSLLHMANPGAKRGEVASGSLLLAARDHRGQATGRPVEEEPK